MIEIRYRRRALRDLDRIRAYIEAKADDTHAAEKVRQHILGRIERLRIVPLTGSPTKIPRLRILFPTKYPYRIYYLVSPERVTILHIRHTSRDVPDLDKLR
jgi:plasmid stabilization system protein ParE